MANMTFKIPPDLHRKMKDHPEIKWSEVLRQAIRIYLDKIENPGIIRVEELRERLQIPLPDEIDWDREIELTRKTRELDEKRARELLENS